MPLLKESGKDGATGAITQQSSRHCCHREGMGVATKNNAATLMLAAAGVEGALS